jgi:hypothetical protein
VCGACCISQAVPPPTLAENAVASLSVLAHENAFLDLFQILIENRTINKKNLAFFKIKIVRLEAEIFKGLLALHYL